MTDEFIKHKNGDNEGLLNITENEENKNLENVEEKNIEDDLKVKDQLNEFENKYKRLLADYQNLQRRTQQEKEDLYKFASQKTIEALIPSLDILDYAKSTLNPDAKVDKLIKDFDLIVETFMKCFKEMGVETIEEVGVPFDPFSHEPLQQIPTNELPPHTVMQVLKKGYVLNKKVLRPALVSVSVSVEVNH